MPPPDGLPVSFTLPTIHVIVTWDEGSSFYHDADNTEFISIQRGPSSTPMDCNDFGPVDASFSILLWQFNFETTYPQLQSYTPSILWDGTGFLPYQCLMDGFQWGDGNGNFYSDFHTSGMWQLIFQGAGFLTNGAPYTGNAKPADGINSCFKSCYIQRNVTLDGLVWPFRQFP